ncbi:MAG: GntR family transcriptional regulator [Halarcobacter sp.]
MSKVFDYELIYNYILKLIETQLQEHERIPSEHTLSRDFNLSRMTVRQGINKLKNEGYLYSRKGSGNFVNPNKIIYNISSYTTFTKEILKSKKTPSIKLLESKLIKADEFIAKKLNIRESEQVLYVKNMRFVDNVPFLFAEYYMNLLILKDVENLIETTQSFSKLYTDIYNLSPIRDSSEIDITSTNYESKKLFKVQNDLPIIKISTRTIDKNTKNAIDYCYSYFRSDMAKIVVNYKEK